MPRKALLLALVALVTLTVAAPSQAAKKKPKTYSVTATATVTSQGTGADGRAIFSGPLAARAPLGAGTVRYENVIVNNDVEADVTATLKGGKIQGVAEGTVDPLAGTVEIFGGTGRFKRVTGSLDYTGVGQPDGSLVLTLTGKLRY